MVVAEALHAEVAPHHADNNRSNEEYVHSDILLD